MKLDEKTAEIFEKVMGYVETAEGFAIEQAPLLVQEVLAYYTAYYALFVCIGFAILIPAFFLDKLGRDNYKRIGKPLDKTTCTEDYIIIFPRIVSVSIALLSTLVVTCNGLVLMKILLAPRLYLLEYLKGFL